VAWAAAAEAISFRATMAIRAITPEMAEAANISNA
jgi:hypothetical protein